MSAVRVLRELSHWGGQDPHSLGWPHLLAQMLTAASGG